MLYTLLFLTAFTHTFGEEEWSYHGKNGPNQWPTLFPMDCALDNQSPIEIFNENTKFVDTLDFIEFKGYDQTLNNCIIRNTGHTVEILPNTGKADKPTISGGGLLALYSLESIHFHWGCSSYQGTEHGQKEAMEAHFVHINAEYATMEEALKHPDGIAVLGVLFEPWVKSSSSMKTVANTLEKIRYAGTNATFDLDAPLESLLPPEKLRYFCRYSGSLTTPNCTEAVIWTIYYIPQNINILDLIKFRQVQETKEGEGDSCLCDNFRPLQPLNGREVVCNTNNNLKRSGWRIFLE